MSGSPSRSVHTLNDLKPGCWARIRRHHSAGGVRQRLLDLGLMPDMEVLMVRSAPLNDPIELKLVDATNVTLRRHEASTIEIYEDE